MLDQFSSSSIHRISHRRDVGTAAETVIEPARIKAAVEEIRQWSGYTPTPLHHLKALAGEIGIADILYKDEGPRFGLGSFKALGGAFAAERLLQRQLSERLGRDITLSEIRDGSLADEASAITLVSATDGNHGRSLSWGAQMFGAPCRIYIHRDVSEGRAEAMRKFGATVIRIDGDYDDSVRLAREDAEAKGWFVVSDTSWEGYSEPPLDVMAGYGVMVAEIFEALDEPPTHIFLQGGVGGLAAGVAAALRQHWGDKSPRVIVVEPELAACLYESAKAGEMRNVQIEEETVMAGLSCGEPSPLAWAILREEAGDFLTIPDSLVGPSMRLLARPLGDDPAIEAGESAVAGLAAVIAAAGDQALREALSLDAQSRVLLIGSEGITDPEIYAQMMREGDDG